MDHMICTIRYSPYNTEHIIYTMWYGSYNMDHIPSYHIKLKNGQLKNGKEYASLARKTSTQRKRPVYNLLYVEHLRPQFAYFIIQSERTVTLRTMGRTRLRGGDNSRLTPVGVHWKVDKSRTASTEV